MKEPLIDELKLKVRGVMPQERLAAMIVAGMELRHLKVVLGYMGGGCWQAYRGQVRPLWDEVCKAQTGITEATERYLIECAHVVKARLAKVDSTEAREILAMMDTRPSKLSDEDRQRLVNGILLHALVQGENQSTLRREFRELREHGAVDETLQKSPALPCESEGNPSSDRSPKRLTLEEQQQEMKAFAMGCGMSERRADEISTSFFRRQAVKVLCGGQNGSAAACARGKGDL